MLRKFIPNLFTLLNMLSGCMAIILAVQNQLVFAAVFVGLGIFFDFFDGFTARLLNVSNRVGTELDSLADMLTSGLVPGIVMMQLLARSLGTDQNFLVQWREQPIFEINFPPLAIFGLLITLASGFRLAKFNVDPRQTSSFVGLPTPANAILILSLPLIAVYQPSPRLMAFIFNPRFLVGLTLFSSILLNAELPLFALKFHTYDFQTNWFRYVFIVFALITLFFLQFMALPLIILVYILFSVALYFIRNEDDSP